MKSIRSYADAVFAMKSREVVLMNGMAGLINCVEAEDGSGNCWNIKMACQDGRSLVVFFRES